jgi:hypothetical protein
MNTIMRNNVNNHTINNNTINNNTINNNRIIENQSSIDTSINGLIDSILISVDAYNLLFNNFSNTNELYYLIQFNHNFNFNDLVNLIKSLLYFDITFLSTSPCQNYFLINFRRNDEIILILHIYNMTIYDYCIKFTEPHFDCNMIYRNYNGYNVMYNYHCSVSIPYDDVLRRLYNKKFSYISDNLQNIDEYLQTYEKSLMPMTHSEILNKFTYAIKLIENGWIMDEYILSKNTWTINYWKNYKNNLNIIKLNNNILYNELNEELNNFDKCYICNSKFNDNDIVFNKDTLFIKYECLFNVLMN